MPEKEKIKDFGQKIGGARKDLYMKKGGLTLEDLPEMTEEEKKKFVVKQNIWIKPDYEKLKEEGQSPEKLYYIKSVYDALPKGDPNIHKYDEFIPYIKTYENKLMQIKNMSDEEFKEKINSRAFYKEINAEIGNKKYFKDYMPSRLEKALYQSYSEIYENVTDKCFLITYAEQYKRPRVIYQVDNENAKINWPRHEFDQKSISVKARWGYSYAYPKDIDEIKEGDYIIIDKQRLWNSREYAYPRKTKEEAEKVLEENAKAYELLKAKAQELAKEQKKSDETKKRKTKFMPAHLAKVQREGPECLRGINADEKDFLDELKFRGGEYGNWESQKERQINNNFAYEAFKDLANALGIKEESISLGNELAIAWGARGHSSALAHYEPARNVINLTKMRGAGSLAHEWGHAFDWAAKKDNDLRKQMSDLVEMMSYKKVMYTPERPDINTLVEPLMEKAYTWIKYQPWYKEVPEETQTKIKERLKDYLVMSGDEKYKEVITNEVMKQYEGTRGIRRGTFYVETKFFKPLSDEIKELTGHALPERSIDKLVPFARSISSKHLIDTTPREEREKTDYLQLSEQFDGKYSKDTMGYWASGPEMFARAFACYVHDKLQEKGITNDYLTGHAYSGSPVPQGEEKELIYKKIDEFIENAKEKGLLKEGLVNYNYKIVETLSKETSEYTKEDIEKLVSDNRNLKLEDYEKILSLSEKDKDYEFDRRNKDE